MLCLYLFLKSPVRMTRIHMRSTSVQQDNWLKWQLKKPGVVIAHLPPQPLFHFHLIRASQLCYTKHLSPNISPLHLPRQEFSVLTHRRTLVCVRPPRAPVPPGAAANEATTPSHVYGALGQLIRGIRGEKLRISQPGRRSTRANVFWVQVCQRGGRDPLKPSEFFMNLQQHLKPE